jgi:hypothetical protein
MQIPLTAGSGLAWTTSPQMDARRRALYITSWFLILAGILELCSFWAVYYWGFVLAVGSIFTGIVQMSHTKTPEALVTSNTVVATRTAFNTLQMMNIGGIVLSIIGIICAAISLYIYCSCDIYVDLVCLGPFWLIFIIMGLIAALTILVCATVSAMKCGEMHREVIVYIPAPMVGPPMMGGAPQPAYGQPVYGQPVYAQPPQPAYGQPQQQYGQPQQNYGQPAYGTNQTYGTTK